MNDWQDGSREVLEAVFREREQQVARYGLNRDLEDGTGPDVRWLSGTHPYLDALPAEMIELVLRREYDTHPKPTWLRLVREEMAEAFKESDPVALEAELLQVAALCVSWIERLRERVAQQQRSVVG